MDLTPEQQAKVLFYTTICAFFPGILALTLPKLAVISLYCRLLNPSKLQKWIMWGGGALLSINAMLSLATFIARCTPFEANYNMRTPNAHCRWSV